MLDIKTNLMKCKSNEWYKVHFLSKVVFKKKTVTERYLEIKSYIYILNINIQKCLEITPRRELTGVENILS